MPVRFFFLKHIKLSNQNLIKKWILAAASEEEYKIINTNYVFTDDEFLSTLNERFLHHRTLTDILTFDDTVQKKISAEIYISVERVQENTIRYGTEFRNELLRVMIHGLLHCCGYGDKTSIEKKEMRSRENYYLAQLRIRGVKN